MRQIVWRGLLPALAGGAAGVLLAGGLARSFGSLFFALDPLDATSFASGAAALLAVAFVAAWGPARRAARVDPVRALRTD